VQDKNESGGLALCRRPRCRAAFWRQAAGAGAYFFFGACFARNKIVFDQIEPKAIICQDRLRTNTDEESCTKKALFGREEELAEACREVRERKTACQCFSIVVFCQDRLGTTTDRKPSKKAAVCSNAGVRHPS
jgi:hypothetical protein